METSNILPTIEEHLREDLILYLLFIINQLSAVASTSELVYDFNIEDRLKLMYVHIFYSCIEMIRFFVIVSNK